MCKAIVWLPAGKKRWQTWEEICEKKWTMLNISHHSIERLIYLWYSLLTSHIISTFLFVKETNIKLKCIMDGKTITF